MNKLKYQFNIIRQGFYDIRDFFRFRKVIKHEEDYKKSEYNYYELKSNKIKNIIYKIVDIPEDYEKNGTEEQRYIYLLDLIKPINNYFQNKLHWGEYLICKFFHFENEEDPKEEVYSYQIEWIFCPLALNRFSFYRNIILLILIIVGIILIGINFSFILSII